MFFPLGALLRIHRESKHCCEPQQLVQSPPFSSRGALPGHESADTHAGKPCGIAASSSRGIRDLSSPMSCPPAQHSLLALGGSSMLFQCPAARAVGRGARLSPHRCCLPREREPGDKAALEIKRFCCLPAGSGLARCSALLGVKGVGRLKEIEKGTLNGLGQGVRGLNQNSSGTCWREKVV